MKKKVLCQNLLCVNKIAFGLLVVLTACAGSQKQVWKAPELPLASFEGYRSGHGFYLSVKTSDEARALMQRVYQTTGFAQIHECYLDNTWRSYSAFKNMAGLIPGKPGHEVITSLHFIVTPEQSQFHLQLDHRTAFFIIKVDQKWREDRDGDLDEQIVAYLKKIETELKSKP